MATLDVPADQSLFARKATGLVRGWSAYDGFIYAFFACNVILGLLTLTYAAFIPGGSLFWAILVARAGEEPVARVRELRDVAGVLP